MTTKEFSNEWRPLSIAVGTGVTAAASFLLLSRRRRRRRSLLETGSAQESHTRSRRRSSDGRCSSSSPALATVSAATCDTHVDDSHPHRQRIHELYASLSVAEDPEGSIKLMLDAATELLSAARVTFFLKCDGSTRVLEGRTSGNFELSAFYISLDRPSIVATLAKEGGSVNISVRPQ